MEEQLLRVGEPYYCLEASILQQNHLAQAVFGDGYVQYAMLHLQLKRLTRSLFFEALVQPLEPEDDGWDRIGGLVKLWRIDLSSRTAAAQGRASVQICPVCRENSVWPIRSMPHGKQPNDCYNDE